jgi:hypothetical protein
LPQIEISGDTCNDNWNDGSLNDDDFWVDKARDDEARDDEASSDTSNVIAMVDNMDINDRSIRLYNDYAASLSKGSNATFPCTILYMDLTHLNIPITRCEPLMLIRNEWRFMVDIFNKRKKGIRGSAIFTGQPGIGEYRYYFANRPSTK